MGLRAAGSFLRCRPTLKPWKTKGLKEACTDWEDGRSFKETQILPNYDEDEDLSELFFLKVVVALIAGRLEEGVLELVPASQVDGVDLLAADERARRVLEALGLPNGCGETLDVPVGIQTPELDDLELHNPEGPGVLGILVDEVGLQGDRRLDRQISRCRDNDNHRPIARIEVVPRSLTIALLWRETWSENH